MRILSTLNANRANIMTSEDNHRRGTTSTSIFSAPWWGFQHDGHPWASFKDYRAAKGYERLADSSDKAGSWKLMAIMYQSWFTFGLIEAVIEKPVPQSSLLRTTEDGILVMSSVGLREILQDFEHRILETTGDGRKEWFGRVCWALRHAHGLLWSTISNPRMNVFRYCPELDDIPSTMYMMGAIAEALSNTCLRFGMPKPQGLSWTFLLYAYQEMEEEMTAEGWCPAISMVGSVSATLFAKLHKPVPSLNGHRACSTSACVGNSVDERFYTTKHTVEGCACNFSKPPLDTIVAALERREIPVITLNTCGDSPSDIDSIIVSNASSTQYVSISHVWADGLGSWSEKGLPSCQLQRIAAMTRQIVPGGAFWMDSLCVPNRRDVRKLAIGLMGDTYRKAVKVLVIDSGVRACSTISTVEEVLLRVATSGWMQRLWTLQEAVLAKELVFELSDGLVAAADLTRVEELWLKRVQSDLAAKIFRLSKGCSNIGFSDVTKALKARSTSRAEDETLAIASLLNVDALKLANLPPDERMIALLSDVCYLPRSVIFLPGPKNDKPGFRWAPKTLMTSSAQRVSEAVTDARCTPQGLVAEYPALYFDEITIDHGKSWFIQDKSTDKYYEVMDQRPAQGTFCCNTILLLDWVTPGMLVCCAAVMVDAHSQSHATAGEFRPDCEYKKYLLLKNVLGTSAGDPVMVRSGRLRVRIT